MCQLDRDLIDESEPIHAAFELSYASYFVLRRCLMEAMPLDWQRRFAQCMRDFYDEFDAAQADADFVVQLRDETTKRFVVDPLSEYRRPNRALIESMRRKNQPIAAAAPPSVGGQMERGIE